MVTRLTLVLSLVASMTTSCATRALWKATDPGARVAISGDEVSEAELVARRAPYQKDEHGDFHLGKTRQERFKDHALRALLTPATVGLDTLSIVPVLACIVLESEAYSGDVIQSGGHGWQHIEPGNAPSGPPRHK